MSGGFLHDHAVWWVKKDFRLADNPALAEALGIAKRVTPLFVLEPSALKAEETSPMHVAAWRDGIQSLSGSLNEVGGEVLVVRGEVTDALSELFARDPFSLLVAHEEVGTERTFARDRAVGAWCLAREVRWSEHRQTAVFRRLTDRDKRSKRWKEWMATPPVARPESEDCARMGPSESGQPLVDVFGSIGLTRGQVNSRQRVTEEDASTVLDSFFADRGIAYRGGISSPNSAFEAGSRLSVHLAWGTITGRAVYNRAQTEMERWKESKAPNAPRWRGSIRSFMSRLHWRDHFIQRLETEPAMETDALNPAYDELATTSDKTRLAAWAEGNTGFPLVDASIRCAMETGFLNFRMRCMVTSVACHALRIGWRDLHAPMARLWADYEPGIHLSQLQMQAGVVGINTLRTYNPAKQIADHDSECRFVKRWVPELADYSPAEIIGHQDEPVRGYRAPIVHWKESTTEMRSDYYSIKGRTATKELAAAVLEKHGSRKSRSRRSTGGGKKKVRSSPER